MVSKLASRIVLFYWYWHRLLNFWYRDTPNTHRYIHTDTHTHTHPHTHQTPPPTHTHTHRPPQPRQIHPHTQTQTDKHKHTHTQRYTHCYNCTYKFYKNIKAHAHT